MAYLHVEPRIGAQPIGTTSTTKRHPLGTMVRATDLTLGEGYFMYAKASIALLAGDAVWIKGATQFAAKVSVGNAVTAGDIAFAQVAFAADEYGWFQRTGSPTIRLTSSTEKETPLYVNASAGVLSGLTNSIVVLGVVAVTSVTTTVGAVQCRASFPVLYKGEVG